MRTRTHTARWTSCLGWPRLLAIVLALALIAPSFVTAADAHEHAGTMVVTAEMPSRDTTDGPQGEVCLICHAHCGCHVGLTARGHDAAVMTMAALPAARPASDLRRPSAHVTRLIRPPKL